MLRRCLISFCVALALASSVSAQSIYGDRFIFNAGARIVTGSGSPEGAATALVGSVYLRSDTGDVYRKTSGTGNTGWVLVPAIIPAALTKSDDTNVTLTLGGTPATALLQAASITPGWTGQLSLARGGTAKSLTAAAGGVVWTDADSLEVGAAGSTGQLLRSTGTTAPAWTTATFPTASPASGTYLRGDGTNWITSTLILPNSATQGDLVVATGANTWGAVTAAAAGKVLRAGGASTVPAYSTATYPDTATTTGAYLRADGTNWITSTLLLPNAATAARVPYATSTNTWGESANLTFTGTAFGLINSSLAQSGGDFSFADAGTPDTNAVRLLSASGVLYLQQGSGDLITIRSKTADIIGTIGAGGNTNLYGYVGHPNFSSQTTAWRVTAAGASDFRSVYADEMRIRLMTIDQESVLSGSRTVAKSASTIAQTFTCPAAGASATLWVLDAPTYGDAAVFVAGDWVSIHTLTRTALGAFTLADCVGQVDDYADGTGANAGQQSWRFVRGDSGSDGGMAAATAVAVGQLVTDYGATGNGVVEDSAVDGAGGVNAPYVQVKTWAGAPVAANWTTRVRFGNLFGQTATANEYGFIAGPYSATNGTFFRASNANFDLHGITAKWWDSTTNVVIIAPNSGSPYMGIGNAAPSACCTTAGIFLGWDHAATKAKASFYTDANNFWAFDGAKVTWKAANTALDASGNLTATSATLSGSVTATTGAIGGFTIGANTLSAGTDADYVALMSGGTNAIQVGDSTFADAKFSVTAAGVIKAISGTVGGWTLGATSLSSGSGATTVAMDSGGTNPAFYAGSATPASAPFRVTGAGALTATNADISGTIRVGPTGSSTYAVLSASDPAWGTMLVVQTGGGSPASVSAKSVFATTSVQMDGGAYFDFNYSASIYHAFTQGNFTGIGAPFALQMDPSAYGVIFTGGVKIGYDTAATGKPTAGTLTTASTIVAGGAITAPAASGFVVGAASGDYGNQLRGETNQIYIGIPGTTSTQKFVLLNSAGSGKHTFDAEGNYTAVGGISGTTGTFTGAVTISGLASGNLTSASGVITSSSDESLKDITGPLTYGLADVVQLHPIRYHWKAASGIPTGPEYGGFGAQQVEMVMPLAVSYGETGTRGLNTTVILGATVNAITEIEARLKALEAKAGIAAAPIKTPKPKEIEAEIATRKAADQAVRDKRKADAKKAETPKAPPAQPTKPKETK